jgi:hypothetical protein
MPRISAAERLERKMIAELEHKCFDPAVPAYVQHRCAATLATMLRRRDRKLELKAAARAARKAAEPMPIFNILPSNGRDPKDWKPSGSGPVRGWEPPAGVNRN